MEIISILLIVLLGIFFLKLFALFFQAGIWVIALPFKILAFLISTVVIVAVLIPLGIVAGLLSIIVLPLALIGPLLPFLLLGLGLWLFLKK